MMAKVFVAAVLGGVLFAPPAFATEFTSPSFKILDPVIDILGGRSTSTSFIQIQAGGQISIGISTSSNFILKSGFLYFPAPPSPSPSPSPSPAAVVGVGFGPGIVPPPRVFPPGVDLNQDNRVDLVDISILLYWWDRRITATEVAAVLALGQFPPDPNGDNFVNIFDLSILLYYWTG